MFAPIVAGVVFGTKSVTGLLAGGIASGVQMAVSASNTGGAWDNAKKYIGKGGLNDLIARVEPDVVNELGDVKQKKSQIYKAAVTGDTVGDPLKDTSGPALNILIKLMSMVSLTVAPLLKSWGGKPGNEQGDFEYWYEGMVPLSIFVVLTLILASKAVNILTWDDPLAEMVADKKTLL